MLLDEFLKRLDNLTTHGAGFKPHKYLFLLTILDLLEEQQVPKNEFPFDARMRHKFTSYFRQYAGENDRNRPWAPFFHLGSSGFWHLRSLPGRERDLANLTTVGGPRELVENVDYGYLSDAVFDLLSNRSVAAVVRERIKTILSAERCLEDRREARESRSAYEEEEGQPSIFAHEERAIRAIRNAIGRGRVLLTNLEIRDSQSNNYFEYDAVLLTNAGIFVAELKHWSGHIKSFPTVGSSTVIDIAVTRI
ncbi:MAG: nuclease-related domain-containing protein [Chloroflexota bacterium]